MLWNNPRVRTIITDEEKHKAALQRAQEAERLRQSTTLGLAFVDTASGSDAFSRLSRYEVTIERSLFRNLHELQRLQAARDSNPVDVEASGNPTGA